MSSLPEHARVNRAYWDGMADEWVADGERLWAGEPAWGLWSLPDEGIALLPERMDGLDAIELGCGTGYVSGWMKRRGARRVVGIDNSARQLLTARRLAATHGAEIEWIHGNAEEVPCADAAFDFAVSEYGAAIWADPARWLPEAWRLLRPGGRLAFLGHTPLSNITISEDGAGNTRRLVRDYFGLYKLDWRDAEVDPGGIEFCPTISGWFALFKAAGFVVEDYLELRAPEGREGERVGITMDWARRFPAEHVWRLRKPA